MSMSDESPSKDSDNDDILTPIQVFYKKIEREVRSKNPQATFADVAFKVDSEWSNLSREERKIYRDKASMNNQRLVEKRTSHLKPAPDVVTIDDSDDEKGVDEDDLVWEDDAEINSTCKSRPVKRAVPVVKRCIRLGCPNSAKLSSDWDGEYCSEMCVVRHVQQVFNSWRQNRLSNS